MKKLKQTLVVEGTYDKIKLSSIIDATIITTDGFQIFKNEEGRQFLKLMAEKTGLIILTDSDAAGFKIRNFIKQSVNPELVRHAYIPDIFGKERRKTAPGKEGKIGVEGMEKDVLINALIKCGAEFEDSSPEPGAPQEGERKITRLDFYTDRISGGENAALRRRALARALGLPERISATMLLDVINSFADYEQYKEIIDGLDI